MATKQLNIILDIDNTLVEYMGVKDSPWPALPDEEKQKYTYYQGFVLRPELWDFFAWMKKLAKTVNLWTLSDREYANWVKEIIEKQRSTLYLAEDIRKICTGSGIRKNTQNRDFSPAIRS
jgi:hypothetical protein